MRGATVAMHRPDSFPGLSTSNSLASNLMAESALDQSFGRNKSGNCPGWSMHYSAVSRRARAMPPCASSSAVSTTKSPGLAKSFSLTRIADMRLYC
eukprot:5825060-Pyramimonas_sp.AAC.1